MRRGFVAQVSTNGKVDNKSSRKFLKIFITVVVTRAIAEHKVPGSGKVLPVADGPGVCEMLMEKIVGKLASEKCTQK